MGLRVELPRALAAAESIGLPTNILDEQLFIAADHVTIATMPLAKGLEFRAVAVIAIYAAIVLAAIGLPLIGLVVLVVASAAAWLQEGP